MGDRYRRFLQDAPVKVPACEGCGKRSSFRLLIPDKGYEYRCDRCTQRKMQDVYDRFGKALNVTPLRRETGGEYIIS